MNYDAWKTTPPDDDPDGDAHQQCPGCPARDGERCEIGCICGACEAVPEGDDATREDADARDREQQIDMQETVK